MHNIRTAYFPQKLLLNKKSGKRNKWKLVEVCSSNRRRWAELYFIHTCDWPSLLSSCPM